MSKERYATWLMLAPSLGVILALFAMPLILSVVTSFETDGFFSFANYQKAFKVYSKDIFFTVVIVALSVLLICLFSIAIAGALTLGENRFVVASLRWLYRWPLFIPFIVAAQLMRTFLAKNGLMNNVLISLDVITPLQAVSFLDWRGIIITFVWKQTPFVTLLLAGAMASIDRATIDAGRNLGAGRLRILIEIVVPQTVSTLMVGAILSVVTIMSVLSVPLMINAGTPTMMTVDIAFRINSYGDYGVANALGVISYLMVGIASWIYLRHQIKETQS
ncbi:ABC transporter permease [Roseibium sp. SCP14]|uniref:ABC transporter permease n=1 Tax=Roseibium sp. SCP14 TaxID=3141375 RepID=UPI00333D2C05